MSSSYIPDLVKLHLWTRAGGRCEYLGCNKDLWTDELTYAQLNNAHIAHIVADSPDGPRGDSQLSEKLKADLSNLMLLCPTHHKLVDVDQVDEHPVELLKQYKLEHEERITWLTGFQPNRKTHILTLKTNIGPRKGCVSFEVACSALLENGKYPVGNPGIVIDTTRSELRDDESIFWESAQQEITRQVKAAFTNGYNGQTIDHGSIFAIAPIPLLIQLGFEIGDIIPCDVYQPHRDETNWAWQDNDDQSNFIIEEPDELATKEANIAIHLSLSGSIAQNEITAATGTDMPTYKIYIENPHRDFLKNKVQLRVFKDQFQQLLAKVRETHGSNCKMHLFPAIPASIAVEIGRCILPKSDPVMHVYDHNNASGGFSLVMTIGQPSD